MTMFGTGSGYGPRRGFNMRWIIALVILAVGVIGYFAKEKVTNPETGETRQVAGSALLSEGFTFELPRREGAIWFYRR